MTLNVQIIATTDRKFIDTTKTASEINLACNKAIKILWISFIITNNICDDLN